MIIKTRIQFADYLKVSYKVAYRRTLIILLTAYGVIMLIGSIIHYIRGDKESAFEELIIGAVSALIIPILTYMFAKRNYDSDRRVHEEIEYEFADGKMTVTGESFKSERQLDRVYRVDELKDWLLIYENKQAPNFIPIKDLSPSDIIELRTMLAGLKNVKLKLRKQ